MEEYLANMKTLRSYMNDLEEEAAKRSAEEQRQRTAIDAHDSDIALVKAQAKQVGDEAEQLAKATAQVCLEIAEKQGRMAALEVECTTLKQTLELLHQEITSTSTKFNEKRLFYTNTMENLTVKLREHQEWLDSFKNKKGAIEPLGEASQSKQNPEGELVLTFELPVLKGEVYGMVNTEGSVDKETDAGRKQGELRIQLESSQRKIEDTKARRAHVLSEINKSKQILEQMKDAIAGFPMDLKSLEEEHKALQGDKAGELEYLHSLKERINEMKGISDPIKCHCGLEYKVELGGEAMGIN